MPRALFIGLTAFVSLLLGGCAAGPLARPAIIGASASAGFGCETTAADGKPYLADMEAVYQATITGWHADPVFLADASFYTAPRKAQQEQIDAALAKSPSIIVGIDYLFWSVYGARDAAMTADQVERDRHDALEQALAQLDRFNGPIIVANIPDITAATARMLSERMVPPPAQLDAFNRRIADWARARPPNAPVAVVPVAEFARAIRQRQPIVTSRGELPPEAAAATLQPDELHPTPAGLAVMLREGLDQLAAKGAFPRDAYRTNLNEIAALIPKEARAAEGRREPGLWTLLSVKGKLSDFSEAVEKKDCAQAEALFDQIMEKTTRLKESPHDMAGLFVSFSLLNYRGGCPDSPAVIRRWRDRLEPAVQRLRPDPWPLTLWAEFNDYLDDESRTVERALALKRAYPELPETYRDTLRSAARSVRYADPAAFLELSPPWQKQLESGERIARGIEQYWTTYATKPEWQAHVDQMMKMEKMSASTDAERAAIDAQRAEYADPMRTVTASRAMTVDDILSLDRALRLTGQSQPADTVRSRLAQLVTPDEIAAAEKRLEITVSQLKTRTEPASP